MPALSYPVSLTFPPHTMSSRDNTDKSITHGMTYFVH
jgi:hypothetical protein